MKPSELSAKLEEYRQLRSEMKYYFEAKSQNIRFTFAITLGTIGLGLKWHNAILFLASVMLVSFFWLYEIRRLKAIFRISTYIQVFIESDINEINWESFIAEHNIQTSVIERLLSNALFPTMYLLNSSFCLYFIYKFNIILLLALLVTFLCIFIYLASLSYAVSRKGRETELEFWLRKKIEKLKNKRCQTFYVNYSL